METILQGYGLSDVALWERSETVRCKGNQTEDEKKLMVSRKKIDDKVKKKYRYLRDQSFPEETSSEPPLPDVLHVEPSFSDVLHAEPSLSDVLHVEPSLPDVLHVQPSLPDVSHVEPSLPDVSHVEPSVQDVLHAEPTVRRFLSSANQFNTREIIHTLSPDEQRDARICRLNKRDHVENNDDTSNKQRRLRLVHLLSNSKVVDNELDIDMKIISSKILTLTQEFQVIERKRSELSKKVVKASKDIEEIDRCDSCF